MFAYPSSIATKSVPAQRIALGTLEKSIPRGSCYLFRRPGGSVPRPPWVFQPHGCRMFDRPAAHACSARKPALCIDVVSDPPRGERSRLPSARCRWHLARDRRLVRGNCRRAQFRGGPP